MVNFSSLEFNVPSLSKLEITATVLSNKIYSFIIIIVKKEHALNKISLINTLRYEI